MHASFFFSIKYTDYRRAISFPPHMAAPASKQTNSKGQLQKISQKSALKKGKAKEQNPEPVTSLVQAAAEKDPWEHDTPWSWTSLSDPSSSRIPPLFTRDGRYVVGDSTFMSCLHKRFLVTFFHLSVLPSKDRKSTRLNSSHVD